MNAHRSVRTGCHTGLVRAAFATLGSVALAIVALSVIVGFAATPARAAQLTSFIEGPTLAYDLNGSNSFGATIGLPQNACLESFALDAVPAEKIDTALVPIDAVLITDVSGSMGSAISSTDPTRKIDLAKSVDTTFVNDFIVPGSSIHRIALVSYSQTARLASPLSSSASSLDSTIGGYTAGGNTCISCALKIANQQLDANGRADALKIIILMTDGLANRNTAGGTSNAKQEAYGFACSYPDSSVNQSFVVNTVAFGSDADTSFLQSIADCSPNGTAYIGTNAAELYAIYANLAHVTGRSWPTPRVNVSGVRALNSSSTLTAPAAIDGSCPGCSDPALAIQNALYECYVDGVACPIPVLTTSSTPGLLNLTNLDVTYSTGGLIPTGSGLICGRLRSCGNGILDPGEQCDSTPGCTANCTLSATPPGPAPVCGNGIQETGEQCDAGTANEPPNHDCGLGPGQRCTFCTTGCRLVTKFEPGNANSYVCGNGLLEPGEQCDAGKLNGIACTPGTTGCSYCSAICMITKLNATGQQPICGDGIVQAGEQCDRGTLNVKPGTTCDPGSASCSVCIQGSCQLHVYSATPTPPPVQPGTGTCGDGVRETPNSTGGNEQCDFGSENKPVGYSCPLLQGQSCTWCQQGTCQLHYQHRPVQQCGDGVIEPPEVCDGTVGVGPHQQCAPDCMSLIDLTYCGDGIKQTPNDEGTGGPLNNGMEQCDGSDGTPAGTVCTNSCTLLTPPDVIIPPQSINPSGCLKLDAYTNTVLDAQDLRAFIQSADTGGPYTWSVSDAGGLGQGDAPSISTAALASGYFELDGVFPSDTSGSSYEPKVQVTGANGIPSPPICIDLSVSQLPVMPPSDPTTRLLITKGTITSGYWSDQISGHVWTWGPYTLSVRVYQR